MLPESCSIFFKLKLSCACTQFDVQAFLIHQEQAVPSACCEAKTSEDDEESMSNSWKRCAAFYCLRGIINKRLYRKQCGEGFLLKFVKGVYAEAGGEGRLWW